MRTTLTLDEDVAGGLLLYAYDPRAPITPPRGSGCGRVVLGPAGATRPDLYRYVGPQGQLREQGEKVLAVDFAPSRKQPEIARQP